MKLDPELSIEVRKDVYAPSDDTYLMLRSVEVNNNEKVLDVGTGTGIIALHCAREGARVVATDISGPAVRNARFNSDINCLDIDIVRADLTGGLAGSFDVVMFNPPYLPAEGEAASEELALTGGRVGSELTIRFLDEAPGILGTGGRVYILTSSLSAEVVVAKAKGPFKVEVVGKKDLFFERLEVLKLTLPR